MSSSATSVPAYFEYTTLSPDCRFAIKIHGRHPHDDTIVHNACDAWLQMGCY